jgi:hypothetical protein
LKCTETGSTKYTYIIEAFLMAKQLTFVLNLSSECATITGSHLTASLKCGILIEPMAFTHEHAVNNICNI